MSRLRQIGQYAGNVVFGALLTVLSVVPFSARVSAMGVLTARAIGPALGYRRRLLDNLALVYPDMPDARRRAFARACLDNFGRTVMENFFAEDFSRHLDGSVLEGDGLAALADARARGRPVLIAVAHFGNHEVPRHLLSGLGDRVGGMFRPMSNGYFDRRYRRTLEAVGTDIFPQGRQGTAAFLKFLQSGGWGELYYDLHQPKGDILPFMGHPAATPISAARIALKVDAPLVPVFAIRQSDGHRFRCIVEAPVTPGDPLTMTLELNRRLEARIAETPTQWLWVHRRWKSKNRAGGYETVARMNRTD